MKTTMPCQREIESNRKNKGPNFEETGLSNLGCRTIICFSQYIASD